MVDLYTPWFEYIFQKTFISSLPDRPMRTVINTDRQIIRRVIPYRLQFSLILLSLSTEYRLLYSLYSKYDGPSTSSPRDICNSVLTVQRPSPAKHVLTSHRNFETSTLTARSVHRFYIEIASVYSCCSAW